MNQGQFQAFMVAIEAMEKHLDELRRAVNRIDRRMKAADDAPGAVRDELDSDGGQAIITERPKGFGDNK